MNLMEHDPEWFKIGAPLMWEIIEAGASAANTFSALDLNLALLPSAAMWFLADAMNMSVEVNLKGRHAHAMLLNRCCIESLTVFELGLIESQTGLPLLKDWHDGKKSQGEVRKALSQTAWIKYGAGIWGETWTEFISQLSKAVQPYAHYTPDLMQWQMAIVHEVPVTEHEGTLRALMTVGPNTYDKEKATAVTLYQCVIVGALGRILKEHQKVEGALAQRVEMLGRALGLEPVLAERKQDWSFIFWPHTFNIAPSTSADMT